MQPLSQPAKRAANSKIRTYRFCRDSFRRESFSCGQPCPYSDSRAKNQETEGAGSRGKQRVASTSRLSYDLPAKLHAEIVPLLRACAMRRKAWAGACLILTDPKMAIERRNFLKQLTSGVAAGAVGVHDSLGALSEESETERGSAKQPVLLNHNENGYGPGPKVLAAVRSGLREINRFPAEPERVLSEALAEFHHKRPEQILVGAGSTAILQMAAAIYLG